jgi:Domain of unknown function (DUF4338)
VKKGRVITIDATGATLRRRIRRHLRSLGYTKDGEGNLLAPAADKDTYRAAHAGQRLERLELRRNLIARASAEFLPVFADGRELRPKRIDPELRPILAQTWESELFRFASLLWRIPVSDGFGRRLRFLVWDRGNDRLMGLLALGDPVFNLRARDNLIGWSSIQRGERLVNVLDAYVLGAVPPYNKLLAGKLIACLLKTRDIVDAFRRKYGSGVGEISGLSKKPRLLLVTTTSALGRSSVYNRLRIDGEQYLESIGFTTGFGHFHIDEELFQELRSYLRRRKDPYADNNRFGQGPSWRFRAIRQGLTLLGMPRNLTQHGFQREVFVCRTAKNGVELLARGRGRPDFRGLKTAAEVGQLALRRWIIPRADRDSEYMKWTRKDIFGLIESDLAVRGAADVVGAKSSS